MGANDLSHSLSLCTKASMSQEPANKLRRLIGSHIKIDQAIVRMAEPPKIEVFVACEEGWPTQGVQQRNDFFQVIHSELANVNTHLPHTNVPCFKLPAVVLKDVLVEYVHAARRRVSRFAINASLASEIASAIASRLMP